ncbi:hypothetical protein PARHAE_03247 [Paracoccus haematequi]|uniref:Uncharacterized protein n=1 Tax=Paracoccus haematequi TaxID=2491866 RepID=A0A447IRB6_9RHOB|nr:hypothetical protein [Paracoccus haematequi]VDS10036.1 hypothetical protein PARHAE_03247 [Paracoccus haematequi]
MNEWARQHQDIKRVTEADRQRMVDAGEMPSGYQYREKMPGQDWDGGWAIRRTERGGFEGHRLAKSRPKLGDLREWLPGRATQTETFDIANLEHVQVSEVEDVATGVISSAVVLGGLRPHAHHPGAWNLMSHPTATLNGTFSSIVIPHPVKLSEMLISAAKRADITGGASAGDDEEGVSPPIITDTPEGGDMGQEVVRDDGFKVKEGITAAEALASPIASVLKDEAEDKAGFSVSGTAICDHAGMTALSEHLNSIAGNPDHRMEFAGIRWAGMLQHGASPATVQLTVPGHTIPAYKADGSPDPAGSIVIQGHNGATVTSISALPHPVTWVAGNEENEVDNPPERAVVDLLVVASYNKTAKKWDRILVATRRS